MDAPFVDDQTLDAGSLQSSRVGNDFGQADADGNPAVSSAVAAPTCRVLVVGLSHSKVP